MNEFKQRPHRPFRDRCVPSIALSSLLAILLLPAAALGQPRSLRPVTSDGGAALREGVVVAPRHGLAYVMRAGGIDAVELASGKVRWHSDRAAKPLALAADRLVAQAESRGANALDLVVLDARSGAARDSVRVPLPAGVAATVVDTAAGSFRVQAASADSRLVVSWEAASLTGAEAQGYLPAVNEGAAPAVAGGPAVVTGEAVVDMSGPSLRVLAEPAVRSAAEASVKRPGLEELRTPAVAAGGRQMLSADGRHVLVTEPVSGTGFTLYRHRWTVYERASGARLGSVPALVAATPFLVVGRTLYHTSPFHVLVQEGKLVEQPAALRAVNLATGKEVWKALVLETSFRGPFPP